MTQVILCLTVGDNGVINLTLTQGARNILDEYIDERVLCTEFYYWTILLMAQAVEHGFYVKSLRNILKHACKIAKIKPPPLNITEVHIRFSYGWRETLSKTAPENTLTIITPKLRHNISFEPGPFKEIYFLQ